MDDLINRQDAINLLKKWADGYKYIETDTELAIKEFKYLPSAQPEPVRRGRWVEGSGMFMCSVCHDVWSTENEEMIKGFNYCPWCGAKMEEEE